MSDPDHWIQQLFVCIASSDGFTNLAWKFISDLQRGGHPYWDHFLYTISDLIPNKKYPANQRFYALYLLFKATEKSDLTLGSKLIKDHIELLNFIYHSAQHDLAKKISFDERGKYFFASSPTKIESRIGVNFVRLCFECLVMWERVFNAQQTNHPCYAFQSYCNSLRKKIKTPSYFYYVDRDYDLSQDLAIWNYINGLPNQGRPQYPEAKQYIHQTQPYKSGLESFTNSKSPQFSPSSIKIVTEADEAQETSKLDVLPSQHFLGENEGPKETREAERVLIGMSHEGFGPTYQENKNEFETSRLKKYVFKLGKVASSPADFGNTPEETNSTQYQPNTRGKSPLSSPQKDPIRPNVYEEKYAQDLLNIQSSITKSKTGSPNSLYGFSTQASSELPGNPSLKSFKSLFYNDDKSSSKANKTFVYSFKEMDDKYSQRGSCHATPQKAELGFSNNTSLAMLPPTLNKASSVQTYMTTSQVTLNRRNTVMGEGDLSPETSNRLRYGQNETVLRNQARSKSPIQWIDEESKKNADQVKNWGITTAKTNQEISSEYYGPTLRKNDSPATSMVLPRKIIKFGLQG